MRLFRSDSSATSFGVPAVDVLLHRRVAMGLTDLIFINAESQSGGAKGDASRAAAVARIGDIVKQGELSHASPDSD